MPTSRPPKNRRVLRVVIVIILLCMAGLYALNRSHQTKTPAVTTGTTQAQAQKQLKPTGNKLYDAVCSDRIDISQSGTIDDKKLQEISGITAARQEADTYFVHNDSGNPADIYAVNAAGDLLATFSLDVSITDWEDIASGPGPVQGQTYIYIADTGDNGLSRDGSKIYRIPEPIVTSDDKVSIKDAEELDFTYPDGASHNVEAVAVDPVSGKIYFIDKSDQDVAHVYEAPAGLKDGSSTMLTTAGTLDYPADGGAGSNQKVTAADISPDGSTIAVRTYDHLYVYNRPAGSSVATALRAQGCVTPDFSEPQGEAVAFTRDSSRMVTTSEGVDQPIHVFTPR